MTPENLAKSKLEKRKYKKEAALIRKYHNCD